jgi:hypothetical protein
MVDSVAVLPPGWRALDANGDPFTDAVLSFFDAGTSDTLEVFSDSGLSTSLGVTVDCNSGGEPVTSGNVPTLIYTGTDPYKITISSTIGGFTRTFDNVKGALDTSTFLTEAAVADQSVVNISANRSILAADKGKLINVNCSGGALTMTLADAATLGDGFFVGIRHAGTANQVKITGDGTDTFAIPGASPIGFSLTGLGHTVWLACDATNFKIHSECPPLIGGTIGVIVIADRLSTPPGSPTPGARYIVGSSPTGDWSGFAQHDIAEADGFGTWFNYTPATDSGWIAYVQDEDLSYQFNGSSWRPMVASIGAANGLVIVNNSGTPTTSIDVDATEAILTDSQGIGIRVSSIDLTVACAGTGANGLDAGSLANNTWYHFYIISDGATTAGLASTSATSPTMPSGYTYKYRVGAIRTGGSATFTRVRQVGNRAQYVVVTSSTTPNAPIMDTGIAGSTTVPTWEAVATGAYVPPTATCITGFVSSTTGDDDFIVAPNNSYGAIASATNPSPVQNQGVAGYNITIPFDFVLESSDIYWAANTADVLIACTGWVDAVNAN